MATINYQGKIFEITDEQAKALERDVESAKRKAIELSAHSGLHGKMVFSQLTGQNSDIEHRGDRQKAYGPIFIIHRAVISEQRSLLWMPSFDLKLKDISPLGNILPIIDKLLLEK